VLGEDEPDAIDRLIEELMRKTTGSPGADQGAL